MTFNRTLEDVTDILHMAKLMEDEILPTSQAIFFSSQSHHENKFRLLELNNDLLKSIETDRHICIKGGDEDDIVFCTETSTYLVHETETSNSLLLLKPAQYFDDIKNKPEKTVIRSEVSEIFQEYLEVTLGKPKLGRLNELLGNTVYKGPEFEYTMQNVELFSLNDLKKIVQASDAEILEAIKSMDVVEIGGKIRQLDFEYHFRVLSFMLKLIEENSWDLDKIDYDETCESLKDIFPLEVVQTLFEKYTETSLVLNSVQLYKYNEREVCRFFARVLLREAGKFNLEDFLQAWKDSVPEGMMPSEEMLHGVAIINRKSNPNVIWALDESTLPDNITDRFKTLFETKDKWTVPEITPYISRLATKQQDANALLAKHTRTSTVDGIKYYSAKHAK